MQWFTHSPKGCGFDPSSSCFACVCFLRMLPPSDPSQIAGMSCSTGQMDETNEMCRSQKVVCSGFMIIRMFLCLQLDQWPRFISARFQYTIYPITFSVGNAEEWKKLFKPCAAQRLFLPVRLQLLSSACEAVIILQKIAGICSGSSQNLIIPAGFNHLCGHR